MHYCKHDICVICVPHLTLEANFLSQEGCAAWLVRCKNDNEITTGCTLMWDNEEWAKGGPMKCWCISS